MRSCGGVVLAFGVLAVVAIVVSFATTYWLTLTPVHFGIWRYCNGNFCGWSSIFNIRYMVAVRALMSIAVGFSVIGLCSNIGWVARTTDPGRRSGCRVAQSFFILAGICASIAVIVFGVQLRSDYNDIGIRLGVSNYGYSFWCAVAGGATLLLLGSISSCATRQWLNAATNPAPQVIQIHTYPPGQPQVPGPGLTPGAPPAPYPTYIPEGQPPMNMYTGQPVSYPPGPPGPPGPPNIYNNQGFTPNNQTASQVPPPPSYGVATTAPTPFYGQKM